MLEVHSLKLAVELKDSAELFQESVGLQQLALFAEGSRFRDTYVSKYQKAIREYRWPQSDAWVLNFESFVRRYASSTLGYQATATLIFDLLHQPGPLDRFELLDIAVLAEATRAREGKRSGIGLDRLQEIQIDDLEKLLARIWSEELGLLETGVDTLVQTLAAHCSAATELSELFIYYIESCNDMLSPGIVERIDRETDGLAGQILRDFCGFSTTRFNQFLARYRVCASGIDQRSATAHEQLERVLVFGESLAQRMDAACAANFGELIARITLLNFFNDNIDVKHSFKSWPGFLIWHGFAPALEGVTPETPLIEIGRALAVAQSKTGMSID